MTVPESSHAQPAPEPELLDRMLVEPSADVRPVLDSTRLLARIEVP